MAASGGNGRRDWRQYLPWVGLPISGVLLVLSFGGSDVGEVWQVLKTASAPHVAVGVGAMIGGLVCVALRWRLLVQPVAAIGVGRAFGLITIGYLVNYVLPGRMGEIARSYLFSRSTGASGVAALVTVAVEKVVDGLVLLGALAILLRLAPLPAGAEQMGTYGSAVFLSVAVAMVSLRLFQGQALWLGQRTIARVPGIGSALERVLFAVCAGLATLELSRRTALAALLTLAIWAQVALMFYLLMLALGLEVPPHAAVVLTVALALGSMVPSAPGFVGTYQFITVAVLAGFSIARHEALAFSVLMHSTEYAVILATGLSSLLAERTSLARVVAVARLHEGAELGP